MHALASVLRNKLVLAALGAAIIGSGAYAFAATLNVSSSSLGAGNASVDSCADSLAASYTTAFASTQYVVDSVKLATAAASTCAAGDALSVTFTGTGALATPVTIDYVLTAADETALANVSGGDITLSKPTDFTDTIPAEDVTGVSVSVAGA